MHVLRTVPIAVLIGASMVASTSVCAEDADAKTPARSPPSRLDGSKHGNVTTKALPPKSRKEAAGRSKAWNEMTPEERKAANDLYLSRPKKWEDMTKAERDAASKAWLFSTGDW